MRPVEVYFLLYLLRLPATWAQTGHSKCPRDVSIILTLCVLQRVNCSAAVSLTDN